ncbi:MAG TPA: hypothetical protein VNM14_07615 [Planctomycetota bacterium]|nr:hypothetical protein [Planctomycetota bacterium]
MGATRTVNLKVHFDDRNEAASCLQGLRALAGATVNVLRGRVTPEAADYDLEIKGREKPVKQAVWTLWKLANLPNSALAEFEEA